MMYNCKKSVLTPPQKFIKCNCSNDFKESIVVDACLEEEIKNLWSHGIKTCGCCCGHGRELGFIEVTDECIQMMEELGYVHYIYQDEFGGVERKDAFIPKSYGHIFDGYSEYYTG